MKNNVIIDVPFGAQDSELKGWEYTIPEGMEAEMKDGKIIVRQKESEDERIRKYLIEELKAVKSVGELKYTVPQPTREECIAWLEKQKDFDKMIVVTPEVWDNAINEAFENGKKESEKQKEQKHPEGCFTCDEYKKGYEAGRLNGLTAGYNKAMKEQQPAEWKPTEEQFNYLAKAIMTLGEEGDCKTAGVLSEIRKGLKCSFPDWKVSPDYPEEGCNVSLNGEVKKIQEWSEDFDKEVESVHKRYPEVSFAKLTRIAYHFAKWADKYKSTEWSEEDERIIDTIVSVLGQYIDYKAVSGTGSGYATPRHSKEIDWLKSLRPSWKPSEEQMKALHNFAYTGFFGDGDCEALRSLYEDLKKL